MRANHDRFAGLHFIQGVDAPRSARFKLRDNVFVVDQRPQRNDTVVDVLFYRLYGFFDAEAKAGVFSPAVSYLCVAQVVHLLVKERGCGFDCLRIRFCAHVIRKVDRLADEQLHPAEKLILALDIERNDRRGAFHRDHGMCRVQTF